MNFSKVAALSAAMMVTTGAGARVYDVAIEGVVSSGYDGAEVFGPSWPSLSGAAFVVDLVFDDAKPGAVSIFGPINGVPRATPADPIKGAGAADPLSEVGLTINGKRFAFPQVYGVGGFQPQQVFFFETQLPGVTSTTNRMVISFNHSTGLPMPARPLPGQTVTFSVVPRFWPNVGIISQQAEFSIDDNGAIPRTTFGQLDPKLVTIVARSALPEPASWAMMVIGFGAIGRTVRRAARQPSVARSAKV